jgi:universal stress protein E
MEASSYIVAGIDFSAASPAVIRHAVHAACQGGHQVTAVHVLDSGSLAHRAASGGVNPKFDLLESQARQRLEALIASEAPGARVSIEIRSGRPADELHRLIEERQAQLLVIAANDLTKKRLGSIASRCVRSAPCDVLVLRDWQEGDFRKVVVCTDFSAVSGRVLERGIALARENDAALEVVHVMYPPSKDIWGEILDHDADSPVSYETECQAEVQREMAGFLAGHAADLSAVGYQTVILESESSAMALTEYVQEGEVDLVVMGTRGHSKLASHFIGTNAERLMQDATVSVYAVRV